MKDIVLNKELPVINMNFEEVKASLMDTMERYKVIIVTEEGLKDCKATQKELAGLRNNIDTYRKTIKKEMEKPIKDFEAQCKELISLVEAAEQPIKSGILVFDQKRKEEKRLAAVNLIEEFIQSYSLEEKYASKLTVLPKYLNLTESLKNIREDLELRATMLKNEQDTEKAQHEMLVATVKTTLESVNKTINTPLKYEDFKKYIDYGWDAVRIIKEINDRADLIRKAEKSKEVVQTQEIKVEPIEPVKVQEVVQQELKQEESLFYVDIKVIHNKSQIEKLSLFLRENGYRYEVNSKGRYVK